MEYMLRCEDESMISDYFDIIDNNERDKLLILITSYDINPKAYNKYIKGICNYEILIPPPNVVAIYAKEGLSDTYIREVYRYFNNPQVAFVINQLVCELFSGNKAIVFLCSKDEKEYRYLKILSDYIEGIYGFKIYKISSYFKNPKKFRKMNCTTGTIALKSYKLRRETLVKKMEEEEFSLEPVNRKDIIKDMKKKMSKGAKKLWNKIKNKVW